MVAVSLINSARMSIMQFNSTFFANDEAQIQGYSYDQRLENVDIDFNVPHTPIVGLGQ